MRDIYRQAIIYGRKQRLLHRMRVGVNPLSGEDRLLGEMALIIRLSVEAPFRASDLANLRCRDFKVISVRDPLLGARKIGLLCQPGIERAERGVLHNPDSIDDPVARRTKNGTDKVTVLSRTMMRYLSVVCAGRDPDDPIFHITGYRLSKEFSKLADRAGHPEFTHHDLKRFSTTALADEAVALDTIRTMSGTKTEAVLRSVYLVRQAANVGLQRERARIVNRELRQQIAAKEAEQSMANNSAASSSVAPLTTQASTGVVIGGDGGERS